MGLNERVVALRGFLGVASPGSRVAMRDAGRLRLAGVLAAACLAGASAAQSSPALPRGAGELVILSTAPATDEAPVCRGYRIVQPGGRVANGDLLEFLSYWDQADAVSADLSLLDDAGPSALPGAFVGDSSVVVGDTLHVWAAYWFTYRISAANATADAAGLRVPIRATAGTASTTNEALAFCLSNHPPRHRETILVGPSERYTLFEGEWLYTVRNGQTLQLETTWGFRALPFFTLADFSAVDDSFAAERVFYQLIESSGDTLQTHRILYELDAQAREAGLAALPVRILARDGGCGRDSVTLRILVDNEPPATAPRLDPLPAQATAAQLALSGTGPSGASEVLVLLDQTREFVFDLMPAGDSLVFSGTVTLQPGLNSLVAYGRDPVGNRGPGTPPRAIELLYAPVFKRWQVLRPDTLAMETGGEMSVADGETLLLRSYWDARAAYRLTADFSALDSEFDGGAVQVTQLADETVTVGDSSEVWATYQIEYTLSPDNERGDGDGLVVPVTALDPTTGFSTTSSALAFCLSNQPPRFVGAEFLGDPERFVIRDGDTLFTVRNGGSVYLLTEWSPAARLRDLDADLSEVDSDFIAQLARAQYVDSLSTDSTVVYLVFYQFSREACCAEGKEPYPLPIGLVAYDEGCGRAEATVWVEMDNEGPGGAPQLDAPPLEATTESSLALSGLAPPGAFGVVAVVEHAEADSVSEARDTELEAGGAFALTVPLLLGENRITCYGLDPVGNRSAPSTTYGVQRLTGSARLTIPHPFRAGDSFEMESPTGWTEVTLELYNLAGDSIRRWAFSGAVRPYVAAAWDGRNGRGEEVRQGPYLLRITTRDLAGHREEEVRALVFQR